MTTSPCMVRRGVGVCVVNADSRSVESVVTLIIKTVEVLDSAGGQVMMIDLSLSHQDQVWWSSSVLFVEQIWCAETLSFPQLYLARQTGVRHEWAGDGTIFLILFKKTLGLRDLYWEESDSHWRTHRSYLDNLRQFGESGVCSAAELVIVIKR